MFPCSQGHLAKPRGASREQIQPSEVTLDPGAGSLIAAASDGEPDADRNGSDRSYFLRLLRETC